MRAAYVVFPGSNCDRDVAVALEQATGRPPHAVWHKAAALPDVDLVALPGGFTYGDYLRPGAIAAHSPVMRAVCAHAHKGGAVLGICNGFQVLTESHLLPGALIQNASLRFVCKDVHLRTETATSPFTAGYARGQVVTFPVAHGDGNYVIGDDDRKRLEDQDRIAFRYCEAHGALTESANPNGSVANIAGVLSENRRVLGLMPHPERLADPMLGGSDGARLFASAVEQLAAA
ncbi:phosphoribosylformylglycinamidine synthase subunit I [Limimonas halophila]|uniref:Phosphoribosylformylglycinamidine synthase subunit PurQ n=1 Tax=Limimonas halophila TaxID=1082479 RepID=A0A1G7QTZ9_9PROT|nr:phosphoribosylformylglycinamidine synthase subunit PurQ [Limimonas halophila]SDG02001.1 phosphoribosylformylglycinamidine synthase subunit I [Limimonas halophila]